MAVNHDVVTLEITRFESTDEQRGGDPAGAGDEAGGAVLTAAMEETEARRRPPQPSVAGIVIGRVTSVSAAEGVWVDYPANPSGAPMPACSTVAIGAGDVGREVALSFERGEAARPIVLGLLHRPAAHGESAWPHAAITADGERVTVSADREIVLRCGDASITLTRAGKILIRGSYLLSRSTGVNRIKGGSVQIN
ncbi:MAG TPA: DUF6484 domain-containing protein [Longimicrobium sp.]